MLIVLRRTACLACPRMTSFADQAESVAEAPVLVTNKVVAFF
jgi:hypothetical protein